MCRFSPLSYLFVLSECFGLCTSNVILGERSVAVPLSPLNIKAGSTEDTIYSDMVPLWLYKRPSLIHIEMNCFLNITQEENCTQCYDK